jgi:hypothetical protein
MEQLTSPGTMIPGFFFDKNKLLICLSHSYFEMPFFTAKLNPY